MEEWENLKKKPTGKGNSISFTVQACGNLTMQVFPFSAIDF